MTLGMVDGFGLGISVLDFGGGRRGRGSFGGLKWLEVSGQQNTLQTRAKSIRVLEQLYNSLALLLFIANMLAKIWDLI